jgi:hypothetical protein
MYEIQLSVLGYADSDDQERAELTRGLGTHLSAYRIADVSHPPAIAPQGAKGSALEWAQLVVGFSGSLPALIALLRSWQQGHRGASIEIEIDGDRLMLEDPSEAERIKLVDTWLERHGRA